MNNGFLLDTNILSRLSPDRKIAPSAAIARWFHEQGLAETLYLSAMTMAEIERGIRKLERRGADMGAARLRGWIETMLNTFDDRLLAMDATVARIAGVLTDHAEAGGHNPHLGDVIIAATAAAYDLVVVTENLRHFLPLGVKTYLPEEFTEQT